MDAVTYITPRFAVTSALAQEDFAHVAASGFRAIINNRPDGEESVQLDARVSRVYAAREGLSYHHVPAPMTDIFTDPVVSAMATALAAETGPVLAHCKSGLRSAIVWAAALARSHPVEDVLGALQTAGFDLDFLRDDLDRQADRARWIDSEGVPTSPTRTALCAAT
jgi:sulfide:quinone oxidoreductase